MGVKRGILGFRRSLISTPTYMDGLLVNNSFESSKIPTGLSSSNDGATLARSSGSGWTTAYASNYLPLDRPSVFEFRMDAFVGASIPGFSTVSGISAWASQWPGYHPYEGAIYWSTPQPGTIYKGTGMPSPISELGPYVGTFHPMDVIGYGYNPILGTMKLWKNGIPLYSGAPVFTGMIGKQVTPALGLYNIGDKVSLLQGKTLKYKYQDYSLSNEGTVLPSQGLRYVDSYRKPATAVVAENGYTVYNVAGITVTAGYITPAFPTTKKTVIEFITHTVTPISHVGLIFDAANQTGPRVGSVPGTMTNSIGLAISAPSGRGGLTANGCVRNFTALSKVPTYGDVIAFGYDPVTKGVKMWINGVPERAGAEIFSNLPAAEVSAVYALQSAASCVRLNPDALRYNYGDYTE